MGGCATKPKVSKDSTDAEDKKAPEPIKEETPEVDAQTQAEKLVATEPKVIDKPLVQEIVDADDDQANRRRSLSSFFKDKQIHEDENILPADEKNPVEEKEEAVASKTLEEIKSESTGETQSNEAVKQLEAENKAADTAKEASAEASGSSDQPSKETEKPPAEESQDKSLEAENSQTAAAEVTTDKVIEVVEAADTEQDKAQNV